MALPVVGLRKLAFRLVPLPSVYAAVHGTPLIPVPDAQRSQKLPWSCPGPIPEMPVFDVGTMEYPVCVAGFCLVYSCEKKKNSFLLRVLKCFGMYTGPPMV